MRPILLRQRSPTLKAGPVRLGQAGLLRCTVIQILSDCRYLSPIPAPYPARLLRLTLKKSIKKSDKYAG